MRLAIAGALALFSVPAAAAPFCIQTQSLPPQCYYWDAAQCAKDAAKQGTSGTCSTNPKEVKLSPGIGAYCVVTSEKYSDCQYTDRASCDAVAAKRKAVCTYNPGGRRQGAPDPYAYAGQQEVPNQPSAYGASQPQGIFNPGDPAIPSGAPNPMRPERPVGPVPTR